MTWRKGDRAAFAETPDVLGRLWALGSTLGAAGLQLSLTFPRVHSRGQDCGSQWGSQERLGSRWKQKAWSPGGTAQWPQRLPYGQPWPATGCFPGKPCSLVPSGLLVRRSRTWASQYNRVTLSSHCLANCPICEDMGGAQSVHCKTPAPPPIPLHWVWPPKVNSKVH